MSLIRRLLRPFYRLQARIAWWDNDRLKDERRHTVKLLVQLEAAERREPNAKRIKEIQAAIRIERAHIAGIDYAMRANSQQATRAAMAAQL